MKKEQYNIPSSSDGLLLDVLEYIPDEVKGIFYISHGMAEHKERYEEFMAFLAENGYVACINDLRGHGKSVKSEKDLGYFYDDTGTYTIEDMMDVVRVLKQKYPHVPFILFGHSMGSMLVRIFMKKYDNVVDRLIVCGSPSANPATGTALALVSVLTRAKGKRHRSKLINKLAFSSYNKNIHDEDKNEFSWLSVNKKNVQDYINNKYDGYIFTLNGFRNLFLFMKETYSDKGWSMQNPNVPVFFIAGSEDPCIVNQKSWQAAQDFMKKIGYTNITNHIYNGYRHEILMEEIKTDVYRDILEFIER